MPSPNREFERQVHSYRFADFELDLSEEAVLREGEKLLVNRRMFQVLLLLVERRGEIITKNEFFDKVWEGSLVEDNNLTVTIRALRKVLGDDAKHARFIENLPRKGYRFIAPVSVGGTSIAADALPTIPAEELNAASLGSDPKSSSRAVRTTKVVFASAAACLIIFLVIGAIQGFWTSTKSSSPRIDSIAILPFENGDPDSEYLADGLTDGISNGLSRLSGVRVIDRNSVFQYKNKTVDPLEVGRELNVQSIMTGHIEQVDDTLVITAELIDLTDNSRPWRQQFTRSKGELMAVQQEIVQAITRDFLSRSNGQPQSQQSKRPTNNAEAYDLYLKGRYYWNKRTSQDMLRAVELFRLAIDKDPTFAKAYVGLGDAYALAEINGISADERVKLAQGAVQRALEIDDTIGEAYAVLGINRTYHDWDFTGAENAYLRALELNPNDATTHHWYAELLAMDGRFDESYRQYDRALLLDPLSLPIRTDLGFAHYYAHDFDASIDILSKSKQINPDYVLTYVFLMFAYREKEMFDETANCIEKGATLQFQSGERPKDSFDKMMKLAAELRKGATESGAKGFWQAELRSGPPGSIYKAVAYAKLGETDKAFEFLEKAFNEHHTGMVWLKVQPDLDGIKSDPRYRDLLNRVGFRSE